MTDLEHLNTSSTKSLEALCARYVEFIRSETLGFSTKKNRDWFDESNEENQKMLATKRSANQTHLAQASCPQKKAAFRLACCTLQSFEIFRMNEDQSCRKNSALRSADENSGSPKKTLS